MCLKTRSIGSLQAAVDTPSAAIKGCSAKWPHGVKKTSKDFLRCSSVKSGSHSPPTYAIFVRTRHGENPQRGLSV
eukprot:497328-Rhodomonas_salina.4